MIPYTKRLRYAAAPAPAPAPQKKRHRINNNRGAVQEPLYEKIKKQKIVTILKIKNLKLNIFPISPTGKGGGLFES